MSRSFTLESSELKNNNIEYSTGYIIANNRDAKE